MGYYGGTIRLRYHRGDYYPAGDPGLGQFFHWLGKTASHVASAVGHVAQPLLTSALSIAAPILGGPLGGVLGSVAGGLFGGSDTPQEGAVAQPEQSFVGGGQMQTPVPQIYGSPAATMPEPGQVEADYGAGGLGGLIDNGDGTYTDPDTGDVYAEE